MYSVRKCALVTWVTSTKIVGTLAQKMPICVGTRYSSNMHTFESVLLLSNEYKVRRATLSEQKLWGLSPKRSLFA